VLGRVYEYFLSQFASAEGKKGGEFYTPRCVVKIAGRDARALPRPGLRPLLRLVGHVRAVGGVHQSARQGEGAKADISIYGQESNYTTWRLAKMNLAIRGIDSGQIAHGDTFHNDRHPDLKADFILANPPFNISDWGGARLAKRQTLAVRRAAGGQRQLRLGAAHRPPPRRRRRTAGFVLANGSMSSNQSGEGEIRKSLIEADLVDCMVALPGQLFYSTQIPVCLWFLARDRKNGKFRDRRGHVLFIDARKLGRSSADRTHKELTDEDDRPHRQHLPRLAFPRRSGFSRDHVHRHPRLLQKCPTGRSAQTRSRAYARPLRRRRGAAGRRGAVRGEDEAAHRDVARAAG
jgi:type I restriction enzyme M protein